MSNEKYLIMTFMLRELSTMKYCYKSVIDGCFDAAVNNKGYAMPTEGKESVVEYVTIKLSELLGYDIQTIRE
jgi:hypothetical protein